MHDITTSLIDAVCSFGRDLCLVVAGAIVGFALTEGVKSSSFTADLWLGILTVFISVLFGFARSYSLGTRACPPTS